MYVNVFVGVYIYIHVLHYGCIHMIESIEVIYQWRSSISHPMTCDISEESISICPNQNMYSTYRYTYIYIYML